MKLFYKSLFNPEKEKRFFYRLSKADRHSMAACYRRHIKVLKHVGLGGKRHLLEKGHVQWNRKGRW
jgi:hypothetical protein